MTSLPLHLVHSCGCQRTQKIQVQIKTKASSTVMKAERNAFALPARILACFPKVLNTTKCHILVKTADVIALLVVVNVDAVQSISS